MRAISIAFVLTVSMLATIARADAPADPDPPRDPGTATMLAVIGTVAGAAVLVGSADYNTKLGNATTSLVLTSVAVATPSLGEWYSGKPITGGLVVRAVSSVFIVTTEWSIACHEATLDGHVASCAPGASHSDSVGPALIGLVGYTVGAAWDIAAAGGTARAYNRDHARTTIGAARLGQGYGLVVMGTF